MHYSGAKPGIEAGASGVIERNGRKQARWIEYEALTRDSKQDNLFICKLFARIIRLRDATGCELALLFFVRHVPTSVQSTGSAPYLTSRLEKHRIRHNDPDDTVARDTEASFAYS